MMKRRHFMVGTLPLLTGVAVHAKNDAYPSRPVRLIIPYAAGGGPDVLVRKIGPRISELLGQPLVMENKVGAAGVLAAQYVAQQPPDGYTILMGSNTHLIQKALQPTLRFDPLADFAPISNMAAAPTVMVVRRDGPYKHIDDVVAAAKANPGKMNYGSGGIGTSGHLAGATFVSLAAIEALHIPLKGSVEIAMSLLRGDTDFAFPITAAGIPHVKSGKLRALAVTSGSRLKELPDVPTLREIYKNDVAVQESWFGFWAPAGTPGDVVSKLHSVINRVLATEEVRELFASSGNAAAVTDSAATYARFVRAEASKWTQIAGMANSKGN